MDTAPKKETVLVAVKGVRTQRGFRDNEVWVFPWQDVTSMLVEDPDLLGWMPLPQWHHAEDDLDMVNLPPKWPEES